MASKMVSLTAEASSTMMRRLGLWKPWKWMADLAVNPRANLRGAMSSLVCEIFPGMRFWFWW